ncbi:hypothetical protein LINGRAHAP2_LOCUS8618, partial [Linum grandiflorum]
KTSIKSNSRSHIGKERSNADKDDRILKILVQHMPHEENISIVDLKLECWTFLKRFLGIQPVIPTRTEFLEV